MQSDGEPLRLVLDRLSARSGIRLSYSREALPLERPVCAAITDAALGDALRLLLAGLAIEPVPVGASHVVLAPATSPAGLAAPSIVYELERLLVTAVPDAAAADRTAHAVSIIEGDELRRFGPGGFAQALNALVPGFWSWGSPAGTLAGGFASLRGASSFGTTAPKVYLDGIEVANPLLLAQLTPEAVERIEVVRGPQGSALYGANAINGVISIVSRRGGDAVDGTRGELRSSAGVSRNIAGANNLLVHDHALNLRAGGALNWARLTVSGGSDLSTPGTGGGHISGLGTGRLVHGSSRLTGTARLHLERADAYLDPGMSSTGRPALGGRTPAERAEWLGRPSASQYTLGATFEHYRNDRWVHTFVAGLDGYRLKPADELGVALTAVNPDAIAVSGDRGVDRFTLRASTLYELPVRDDILSSFTLTAEQLFWRRAAEQDPGFIEVTRSPNGTQTGGVAQRSTGISGQADVAFRETVFLTGGLRLEHTGATGEVTPLPQLGASAVARHDDWTLTLRTAYGRAMRSPALPGQSVPAAALAGMTTGLQPELQEGIEAGLTLRLGKSFSLDVTRFDQTASNLTQWIGIALNSLPHAVSADVVGRSGGAIGMQNIGEIANRGWEVQSTLTHDRLSVVATASQVDSRATQLPGSYAGDLRPGDRMPGVPSHTAALMGVWQETPFSVSLGLSRAWGWIDYDRERLALDIARLAGSSTLAVEDLRDYWKEYNGGLGVDGSVSLWPVPRLGITLRGSNLLDNWLGGSSNTAAYHRRSAGVELRLRF